jgi:poly(3-hydroxybutyrate) depolymerase
MFRFVLIVCSLLHLSLSSHAQTEAPLSVQPAPVEIVLPSAKPSGNATNDRIVFTFFPARPKPEASAQGTPAVILLHFLGATGSGDLKNFARDLSKRGIAGAVMTLPFHMERLPRGQKRGGAFVDKDLDVVAKAFEQSASDVRTVTDWLSAREGVDETRIGIAGISLGAIITHLAMGQDARLTAGVAILGGGNLPDIYTSSFTDRFLNRRQIIPPTRLKHFAPSIRSLTPMPIVRAVF